VQCQLVGGTAREKCYRNIRSAMGSSHTQSGEAGPPVRSGVPSEGTSQTEDADKAR
jgi:hypothetical protein